MWLLPPFAEQALLFDQAGAGQGRMISHCHGKEAAEGGDIGGGAAAADVLLALGIQERAYLLPALHVFFHPGAFLLCCNGCFRMISGHFSNHDQG